ncbi:MAG: insulinase family protein [Candidatus Woesebacteria bacterium]|nr:MAG: insulinase family protein [Candidatus Woesebacteria bacterium]
MNVVKHKLKNGLRVLVTPMPSVESATVTFWVGVGSKFEDKKIGGISHFTEHIVFKGSKKRPSAREISQAVDAMGGEFNAGTSKEWTNFYIKARASNLDKSMDVLSDMVLNPLLREEDIEKEKGVILEEMAMYEDTPVSKIGDVFENLIFENTSLGEDIIGTKDSVKSIKREDFLRYRKLHYHTENMLLTVAGGVKEKEVMELTEKYFGIIGNESKEKEETKIKVLQNRPRFKLVSKKNEQAHLILGYLGNKLDNSDQFKEEVLATILGGGMSSRLFIQVRERRGLAYSVRSDTDYYVDTGYIGTYAGVDPKKATEAIKVMIEEHNKMTSKKLARISKEELAKAKEFIKGHLALALENTRKVNEYLAWKELLLNKLELPEDIYKGIDKVSVEDVIEVAKRIFKPQNLNLAIIGPFKDKSQFEKLL